MGKLALSICKNEDTDQLHGFHLNCYQVGTSELVLCVCLFLCQLLNCFHILQLRLFFPVVMCLVAPVNRSSFIELGSLRVTEEN